MKQRRNQREEQLMDDRIMETQMSDGVPSTAECESSGVHSRVVTTL